MATKWQIVYWELASGKQPIFDFIEKQPKITQAKIYNTFELVEEYGVRLHAPHVKKITNTPLWELRILGSNSLRFFYIVHLKNVFLILHVFKKKANRTPKKELSVALKRYQTYIKTGP